METAIFNAFYLKYESDDVYCNHSSATEGSTVKKYRKAPNNATHMQVVGIIIHKNLFVWWLLEQHANSHNFLN